MDNRKLLIQIQGKKKLPQIVKSEPSIEDFILTIDMQPATVKSWFKSHRKAGAYRTFLSFKQH